MDTDIKTGEAENSSIKGANYEELFKAEQARRRGLQSENAKLKNELHLNRDELAKVKELSTPKLSSEEQDRLDSLKYSDPEAWREAMNSLESSREAKVNEFLNERKQVHSEKLQKAELDQAVEDLQAKYSDFKDVISENTLVDNIPYGLTAKYKKGEISVTDYLEKAYTFITAAGVINPQSSSVPDLSAATGSSRPSRQAVDKDLLASYKDTIF